MESKRDTSALASAIIIAAISLYLSLSVLADDLADLEREAIDFGPGIVAPKIIRQESGGSQEVLPPGTATVKCLIDTQGVVREVIILEASDPKVARLAKRQMLSQGYSPATKDGRPVVVWWTGTLRFQPAEEKIKEMRRCDPDAVDTSVPVEANGTIELPQRLRRAYPYMSPKMRHLGNGFVDFRCVIDRCGRVNDCVVLDSSGPDYTDAARSAVSRWLYTPAKQDGIPVAIYFTIHVDFKVR